MLSKLKILAWRNDFGERADDLYGGVGYYRIVKPLSFLQDKYDITSFGRQPIVYDKDGGLINVEGTIPYLISQNDICFIKNFSNLAGLMQFCGACEYFNKPLILDMDDDYFAVDNYHPNYKDFKEGSVQNDVHALLFRTATAITVSTKFLKEVYKPYCPNIHHLPNYNDIEDWNYKKIPHKSGRIVIGYCGSMTHEKDLMMIMPVYKELWKKYGMKILFSFHSTYPIDIFDELPRESYEIRSGTSDIWLYMPGLAEWGFDIGLAPLEKLKFNESKGHGKWMEYAMYKIPCVASDYGPYKSVIIHGQTGLLSETTKDWIDNISYLIENPKERERIGKEAFAEVKERWQWKDHVYKWDDVFRKYLGRGFKR